MLGSIGKSLFGGGSSKTKSNTTTSANEWTKPYYQTLFTNATNQYNNGGFYSPTYFNGQSTVAGLTPEQQAAIANTTNVGNIQQGLFNTTGLESLKTSLGQFDPNNPALTGAISTALNENTINFQRNVLPSIAGNAMVNGMTGSNRQGVAQGLAMSDLNRQNLATSSQMVNQAYGQHEAERNATLANLGTISKSLNSGNDLVMQSQGALQDQRQTEINAALQSWAYSNDMPLKNLTALQSLLSSVTPADQSSQSKGTAPSGGGLGGMLGSMAGSWLGSKMG